MDTMKCPICDSAAEVREDARDVNHVVCETCGRYGVTLEARLNLPNELSADERYHLSAVTRLAFEEGSPITLTDRLRVVLDEHPRPADPTEMMDLLLAFIARKAPIAGEAVAIRLKTDYPVAFTHGASELSFLLDSLRALDLIGFVAQAEGGARFRVTIKGWRRLAELKVKPRKSRKAFVAMWFDASMDPIWEDGLKSTLEALDYEPIRVDRQHHNGKIDDFIVASIRDSALLVADVTGHRAGVYFEAGLALGLGIPVVWTCRADEIGKAHFDTRQYNHVLWNHANELAKKLRERIEATITDRPVPRSKS